MYSFSSPPVVFTYLNKKIHLFVVLIWILTTSQQCTNTDACGTFPNNINTANISLTLTTNIPSGVPRPFTEIIVPYLNPLINICKSTNSTPATVFNIKTESYLQCNGVPRSKITACITAAQSCPTTNVGDLQIAWNSYFRNKVTIRAISYYGLRHDAFNIYYAIYEGSFDIEANQTSLSFDNLIINLTLKGVYTETTNFNIITDLCNTF